MVWEPGGQSSRRPDSASRSLRELGNRQPLGLWPYQIDQPVHKLPNPIKSYDPCEKHRLPLPTGKKSTRMFELIKDITGACAENYCPDACTSETCLPYSLGPFSDKLQDLAVRIRGGHPVRGKEMANGCRLIAPHDPRPGLHEKFFGAHFVPERPCSGTTGHWRTVANCSPDRALSAVGLLGQGFISSVPPSWVSRSRRPSGPWGNQWHSC